MDPNLHSKGNLKVTWKCYWSASWGFVWMLLGGLDGLYHFSHETVTVITAFCVTVYIEHRQWETWLENMVSVWRRKQWPVIIEMSLKVMLKPMLYRERVRQLSAETAERITACSQGKTLWAEYMSWDPAGTTFSTWHLTETDRPSSVTFKLMQNMVTDR